MSWYASDLQKPNKFFWDMQGSIPGPHGSESDAFTTPPSCSSLRDSDLNYLYLQVISSNSYFKRIWTNRTFVYDYLIIYSWSLYYWVCYKTYFLLICQIYYLFTYSIWGGRWLFLSEYNRWTPSPQHPIFELIWAKWTVVRDHLILYCYLPY